MKSLGRNKLKAQLVFEFIVAVVIFFGIIIYALNYLSWTVVGYSADSSLEIMESEATQIGELLVMNKGNWSGGVPITPGLALEWPVLNSTKISWLNASCNSDYDNFLRKIGLPPKHRLKIMITETATGQGEWAHADCMWGVPISGNVTKAETRRYALSENKYFLTVYVGVWSTGK